MLLDSYKFSFASILKVIGVLYESKFYSLFNALVEQRVLILDIVTQHHNQPDMF